MVWSIAVAKQVPEIDEVFVSTDSKAYGKLAKAHGAKVIRRMRFASLDNATDREVLIDANLTHSFWGEDLWIYLRPTTPFRSAIWISKAITEFLKSDATSLRSMEKSPESAAKWFTVNGKLAKPLSKKFVDQPNQKCPITYKPNGYVDIIRAEYINTDNIWGPRMMAFITNRTVELDEPEDLEYAEWIAKRRGYGEAIL